MKKAIFVLLPAFVLAMALTGCFFRNSQPTQTPEPTPNVTVPGTVAPTPFDDNDAYDDNDAFDGGGAGGVDDPQNGGDSQNNDGIVDDIGDAVGDLADGAGDVLDDAGDAARDIGNGMQRNRMQK